MNGIQVQYSHIYCPPTKLWQGNVFTSISIHGEWRGGWDCVCLVPSISLLGVGVGMPDPRSLPGLGMPGTPPLEGVRILLECFLVLYVVSNKTFTILSQMPANKIDINFS